MTDLRSSAVVLLLVGVLLLSSGAFAPLWTDTSSFDHAAEGSPALQLLWAMLYVVLAGLVVPHLGEIGAFLRFNRAMVLLVALCFFSAIWSEDPLLTLRKSLALTGTTLAGILLAWRYDLRDQVRLIATVLGIVALASLVAGIAFPSLFPATEFSATAWNGVFSHKNLLGRSMCLGTVAFLTLERRTLAETLFSFSGATLCFAMLLLSHSQTALLVLVAMVFLMGVAMFLRVEWRQALGSLMLSALASVPIAWIVAAHNTDIFALLGRDSTLTGRTRIWQLALLSIGRRPWLGYGYGAFWWVSRESRQALALLHYQTPHAHNAFLDLALQLGIVGLAAFLLLWLFAMLAAVHHLRSCTGQAAQWPLLCLTFAFLYSFSESSLPATNSLLWILFTAACVSTVRERQIQRQIVLRLRSLHAATASLR